MHTKMSGGERRQARRNGSIQGFTRAQATREVVKATSFDECKRWSEHPNKHVRRYAFAKALKLGTVVVEKVVSSVDTSPSEFDVLVARFTNEGKKDPIRSARASIAAKAQAAQKRAATAA